MADIDFKNGVNVDTAFVDGHKVKLIAVPDGTLELPISANDEYGYVVDANGKKHRVLLVTFLAGDPDYKPAPNADTAYMTVNSQKVKVRLGAKLNGTQYLSNSANVNDGYTEDDDGNKHRTILVSEPTGTLELPTSETDDSAYVIDNDGNKHKVRLFAVLAGGTTIVEVTVSGVPPLNLLGAVEDSLSSVKAYGGLLQGGVPSGYTALEYVQNATRTLVPTDFIPVGVTSVKVDLMTTVSLPSASTGRTFYIFQARETTATTIFGISGAQSSLAISGSGANNSVTSSITRTNGNKYRIVWEATNGTQTLTVDDLTAETTDTKTNTYTTISDVNSPMCLFGNAGTLDPSGTATEVNRIYQGAQVYYAKMWANGKLVLDLVPAKRNSDNAVGFYNKANGAFYTASEGSLTAGNEITPTPSDPVDLVCNNGALKVLDKSQWTIFTNPTSVAGQGVFISSDGKWYNVNDRGAGCAIPLTIGKQYTLVIHKKTATIGTILRYGQSPQGTPTLAGIQLTDWYRGEIADGMMISFVAKQAYFVMQFSSVAVEAGMVQEAIEVLEAQGDNETLKLTPSNDTAGVANLLKISNYVDTQEILTGLINHQLGILVLDGTENWAVVPSFTDLFYIPSSTFITDNAFGEGVPACICSHFNGELTTVNGQNQQDCSIKIGYSNAVSANHVIYIKNSEFNNWTSSQLTQWLSQQYAAGTPVIIVYPLATAQDEVAPVPQTMQTVAGDNVLEIVQAGMGGLEVSATYLKGVSVTITEIEDANIGNSVEVVIA